MLVLRSRLQAKRWGPEVSLEEYLLQPLERSLNRAGARDRRDVGERYILYPGPERASRYVARALQYSACHFVADRVQDEKKPGR